MEKWTLIPCNLCGSDEYSVRYRPTKEVTPSAEFFGVGHFLRGTQQIVQCKQCQLVYVNPRLETEFIKTAYENNSCEEYLSQAESRKATFKRSLVFLEKYVAPNRRNLLDVGCGAGLFLAAAKERNWRVHGVELCRWFVEKAPASCRSFIQIGTLQEARYPDESFDTITLWDVIEHLPNPKSSLLEIQRLLKKGGFLVINFPDIDSFSSKITRSAWWYLISTHLYYFSTTTLKKLLTELGFSMMIHKTHLQILQLGYLIQLLTMYHQGLGQLMTTIVKGLQLGAVEITFSSGETTLIAQKK